MAALDKPRAMSDVAAAVARLKAHPRSNGKVAVVGFCMGGGFALAAARQLPGIAAAVPFYGIPPLPLDEYAKIRVPIQAHFAKRDDFAKASAALDIQAKVRGGGGYMELFVYEAGHAFMRSTARRRTIRVGASGLERALEFLKRHLE